MTCITTLNENEFTSPEEKGSSAFSSNETPIATTFWRRFQPQSAHEPQDTLEGLERRDSTASTWRFLPVEDIRRKCEFTPFKTNVAL